MAICRTAYDTTACRGQAPAMRAIISEIQEALVRGVIKRDARQPVVWVGSSTAGMALERIRTFLHPMLMETKNEVLMAVDARNYGQYDPKLQAYRIRSVMEHTFLMTRARLQLLWTENQERFLRDFSPIPGKVFANWVSQNLAIRFNLSKTEEIQIKVTASLYYYSMFIDGKWDESQIQNAVRWISKNIYVKAQEVFDIIDLIGDCPTSIDVFCKQLTILAPIRLSDMSVGLLMTLLQNTWYNSNVREVIGVALEHPPTWVAMVGACVADRSYTKTNLNTMVSMYPKAEAVQFLRQYMAMIQAPQFQGLSLEDLPLDRRIGFDGDVTLPSDILGAPPQAALIAVQPLYEDMYVRSPVANMPAYNTPLVLERVAATVYMSSKQSMTQREDMLAVIEDQCGTLIEPDLRNFLKRLMGSSSPTTGWSLNLGQQICTDLAKRLPAAPARLMVEIGSLHMRVQDGQPPAPKTHDVWADLATGMILTVRDKQIETSSNSITEFFVGLITAGNHVR